MCVFHKNRVQNNKACISYAGLAYEMDESDLQEVFQQYGSLIEGTYQSTSIRSIMLFGHLEARLVLQTFNI